MSRYDNLVTEKSAGAGIAARLTEQRHRGPGSAAHAAEHNLALVGPVASKVVSPVVALLLPPGVVPEYEFHESRRWRFGPVLRILPR